MPMSKPKFVMLWSPGVRDGRCVLLDNIMLTHA